jgi:hypothetical protein
MKKYFFIVGILLALTGCSSTEQYKLYADSHAKMETAKYNAEAAKYKAMSDIANNGTEAAKVAAVMAIALGGNSNVNKTNSMQAPQQSEALQWAQILVPGVIQSVGIIANRQVAITQSNNSAAVANSTNAAFVGMASRIQAPVANISNTTSTTSTQTLSGNGTLGSGAYSLADSHDSTTSNPTTSTTTLSGSGTLGSGAYDTLDNNSATTTSTTAPVFSPVPVTVVP